MSSECESEEKQNPQDPFESVTDPSDTAEEFLQKLDLANDRWHKEGFWIFRGQNDSRWELIPSLFRDWNEDTLLNYEIDLIDNFLRTANLAGLRIPSNSLDYMTHTTVDGRVSTQRKLQGFLSSEGTPFRGKFYDFSHVVFAIAQHSGIPTRLLDFTYDPLIAAFHCADWNGLLDNLQISSQHLGEYFKDLYNRPINSPVEIVSAWTEHFEKVSLQIAKLPKEMAVWAIGASGLVGTTIRMLDHPYSEILNLRVQKGIFLCDTDYQPNGNSSNSLNGKLSQLVDLGQIYKLTLPCTEREKLLELLNKKRISPFFVKPTYESVAQAVVAQTVKRLKDKNA